MTETNLYDSIALADRIKLQCKSRNVQIKDVMDSANLSNGITAISIFSCALSRQVFTSTIFFDN